MKTINKGSAIRSFVLFISMFWLFAAIPVQAQTVFPQSQQQSASQGQDPMLTKKAALLLHQFETNIRFEAASTTPGIRYQTGGNGYVAGFANEGVWFNQHGRYDSTTNKQMGYAWQMKFVNAGPGLIMEPAQKLSFPVHHYTNSKITTSSDAFQEIWYRNVYRNTDCRFYGNTKGELEYDFVLQPGADPTAIALSYNGLQNLKLENDGRISFLTTEGIMYKGRPYAYQLVEEKETEVPVSYIVSSEGQVSFEITGKYDEAKPLIIDPVVLQYGTFIGGSRATLTAVPLPQTITTDAAGNIYIAANAIVNTGLVTTPGAYDNTTQNGDYEISSFTINGQPRYITYYGGNGSERAKMYLNGGFLYLAGSTRSGDLPGAGAYTITGVDDAFLARFNAATGNFNYATIFNAGNGGNNFFADDVTAITFNSTGDYYVAIQYYNTNGFAGDPKSVAVGAVYKFNSATNTITAGFPQTIAGTFVVNEDSYVIITNIGVTSTDKMYVFGSTDQPGLATTANAFKATNPSDSTNFLNIYDGSNGNKIYSTYDGGINKLYNNSYHFTILPNDQLVVSTYGIAQPTTDGVIAPEKDNTVVLSYDATGTRKFAKSIGGGDYTTDTRIFPAGNDFIMVSNVDRNNATANTVGTPGALQQFRQNTSIRIRDLLRDMFVFRMDTLGNKKWATFFGFTGKTTQPFSQLMSLKGNEFLVAGNGEPPVTANAASNNTEGGFITIFNATSGQQIYGTHLPFNLDSTGAVYFDANEIHLVAGTSTTGTIGTANALIANSSGANNGVYVIINRCTGQFRYISLLDGNFSNLPLSDKALAVVSDKAIMGYLTKSGSNPQTSDAYQPLSGTIEQTSQAMPVVKIFDLKYNNTTSNVISPASQTVCRLASVGAVTGNQVSQQGLKDLLINGITQPQQAGVLSYQWQSAPTVSGPWTDVDGAITRNYTPLSTNVDIYYRRNAIDLSGCTPVFVSSSNVSSLLVNSFNAPTANAGDPRYICTGSTASLNATATGGSGTYTYQWFTGDNPAPVSTSQAYTTPAITVSTIYTLEATDANGCIDLSQITLNVIAANAGSNVSFCEGQAAPQIGMDPYAGSPVVYEWTPATGLSCTTCSSPVASPVSATTYTLTIKPSVAGAACPASSVTVTPTAAPAAGFAGTDQTICLGSTADIGTGITGFTTTWTPGIYLTSQTAALTTFSSGSFLPYSCPVPYTLTAVSPTGCTYADTVSVSVIDPNAGPDNCRGWFGIEPALSQAGCVATYTWAQTGGSGTGSILSYNGNHSLAYLKSVGGTSVFTRTTALNGVSCSDEVNVFDGCGSCITDIVVQSQQQCPKVFPGLPLTLTATGVDAADYYISWTPANIMDHPNEATVHITSMAPATVTVTATNKIDPTDICTKTIDVNQPAYALPVFTAADVSTCPNVPVTIGAANVSGYDYNWTPVAGLNSSVISNPVATVATTQSFVAFVKETVSGCTVTDTSTVSVVGAIANAGPDMAVCNSAVVTLGTPAINGLTYAWSPAASAWQNGTNENSAQPDVLVAANQAYIVTVTAPGGCTAKDTANITLVSNSDSYLGNPATICAGSSTVIGIAVRPNVAYSWTPATGLSCTNCAQPVASPASTQSYQVSIGFPGCTLPAAGTVTVTVINESLPALTNQTVCSSSATGVNIGYVADPAGVVSYVWSPATYLDNATIANPTSLAPVTTTYTVTATFSTGCTATQTVTVTPVATVKAGIDKGICPGGSTTIGDGSNPVTTTWLPVTGLSCTTCARPTANPAVTTTYVATYDNGDGCTVTDTVIITVNTPPAISLQGNTSVCGDACTLLSATPNAGFTYQWSPATGVASPKSASSLICPGGVSTVYRLYQTDPFTGCINFAEASIIVNPGVAPVLATNDINICAGEAVTLPLTVSPAGTYTYSWSNVSTLNDPYVKNPVAIPSGPATYRVVVTSSAGCQNVATVKVTTDIYPDFGDLLTTTWPVASVLQQSCRFTGNAPSAYNASTNPYTMVWAGAGISTETATVGGGNTGATTDAFDDGLGIPVIPLNGGYTYPFTVTANSNTPTTAYYRMWFDWNADGNFANDLDGNGNPATYAGMIQTAGPATVTVAVKPPFGALVNYKVRLIVTDNTNTVNGAVPDYYRNGTSGAPTPTAVVAIVNGEVEDYNAPAIILPITFGSVTAEVKNCNVFLLFETLTETNNKQFEVEYSTNGNSWKTLAVIPSKGNSATRQQYSYVHSKPVSEYTYYRIKQVDRNGSFSYSTVVTVRSNCAGAGSIVSYPNPVQHELLVVLPLGLSKATVILLSAIGQQVATITATNGGTVKMNTSMLSSGIYLLQVQQGGKIIYNQKVIKE